MSNTRATFHDKWYNDPDCAFSETLREGSEIQNWILNRNGFKNIEELREFLKNRKRILDAGCGNGRVTALLRKCSDYRNTQIVACDLVSSKIAKKNLSKYSNICVYEKDLLGDLSRLGRFDFIYCQEVLHHTKNPQQAFINLCGLLKKGGEIAVYVYKLKSPVREFTDDFIRNKISSMPYEEALKICSQITDLGKALSELKMKFISPAVDLLEIPAGEYDIQRFFYHFFMKCFWNQNLSQRDNIVINYDWYHPQDCSKHTIEEVRRWYNMMNLKINHEFVDHYGITIKGIMP